MVTFHQAFIFSHCNLSNFIIKLRSIICIDCTVNQRKWDWAKWARWAKILKITQPDNQLWSLNVFLYLHDYIKTFIYLSHLKSEEKSELKVINNTLTDEQLCSLICCFLFACSNMYQNIFSFIAFEIRKTDWAKWAKRLKNTHTDE